MVGGGEQRGMYAGGGGQARRSFFSIVRHASTQRRTPAPRGMASQHLRTFERVPVNKELLTGTVLVNKKLLTGIESRSITSSLFKIEKEILRKIKKKGMMLEEFMDVDKDYTSDRL